MAEKHPHIDMATEEQLAELLQGKGPEVRETYLAAHRLILATLSDINYSTDTVDTSTSYGIRQYGYNGWGMAALSAHTKWVSLYFMRGAELDHSAGILEGTGKRMRHVKLRSRIEFEELRKALEALIVQAATLHGHYDTTKATD